LFVKESRTFLFRAFLNEIWGNKFVVIACGIKKLRAKLFTKFILLLLGVLVFMNNIALICNGALKVKRRRWWFERRELGDAFEL
jgi:hypothetical protein